MLCTDCGSPTQASWKHCSTCGAPLAKAVHLATNASPACATKNVSEDLAREPPAQPSSAASRSAGRQVLKIAVGGLALVAVTYWTRYLPERRAQEAIQSRVADAVRANLARERPPSISPSTVAEQGDALSPSPSRTVRLRIDAAFRQQGGNSPATYQEQVQFLGRLFTKRLAARGEVTDATMIRIAASLGFSERDARALSSFGDSVDIGVWRAISGG